MKVWLVGVSDCESNSVICLCDTKELAVHKLFEERDKLINQWKESIENMKEYAPGLADEMYTKTIKALEGDDYENWDNYPHDRPYICEMEVLEAPKQ